MKKYIGITILLFAHVGMQAHPFVITFVNRAPITIEVELYFSNQTIGKETMQSAAKSGPSLLPVKNFDDKLLTSVIFSSPDKDGHGNMYGQVNQKIAKITSDTTYNITLGPPQAQTKKAPDGTNFSYKMQSIMCTAAPTVLYMEGESPILPPVMPPVGLVAPALTPTGVTK